jgi:predicted RNA polymerase sigma factor
LNAAQAAIQHCHRHSWGRLVALLASRSGDLAGAEDALSDAFAAALQHWPTAGVPHNPDAWLLTSARNRLTDTYRSAAARCVEAVDSDTLDSFAAPSSAAEYGAEDQALPDKRLHLLFVCAHPAISSDMHTPLMLQTVLGLEAQTIARAFAVPAPTMAQRLVRAKRKIKEAGIRFELPDASELLVRQDAVLEAVYGAFAMAWDAWDSDNPAATEVGAVAAAPQAEDLAEEARFLSELLAQLMPSHAEALGLAALIALICSRRSARTNSQAKYIPLSEQDTRQWNAALIAKGTHWLMAAHRLGQIGRFQLEAAIQSVHLARASSGRTDWAALALLYEGLVQQAPSLGAAVGRALAVGHAQRPADGLAALDLINADDAAGFQPLWAARAELLAMAGQPRAAAAAIERALALTHNRAAKAWLLQRQADLLKQAV